MRLADTVGRNRGAFNRVCLVFLTVAICLIKDIVSAYILSLWTLKSSLSRELYRTRHMAWPGRGLFNTGSTDMNFTGFDGLSHILHTRFSCRNAWKLWDYCMCPLQWSATPQWHLAEVFRQLWPNSELLLGPAYLTFGTWLQQTSLSLTLRLWKQSGRCCVHVLCMRFMKGQGTTLSFSEAAEVWILIKHTTVKLGQDGAEEENGLSWKFYLKRQKTQAMSLKVFSFKSLSS